MSYTLQNHQYGKAETRLVRIYRDAPRHEIRDVNVTTALRGSFEDAYLTGDQSKVLPTDSQKNTVVQYTAKNFEIAAEDFGLTLARHFVDDVEPVSGARIEIEEFGWRRAVVDGEEHDHTWLRTGPEVRTAAITVEGEGEARREHVIGGVKDLVLLKSTGSEFAGFLKDEYTTLPETHDRVMATSVVGKWRFATVEVDWEDAYTRITAALVKEFATLQSLALQQTLWHMGTAVLDRHPEIVEIRLTAPNKHHFDYDIARFGVEQKGEVFHADDRPYGLIEAVISREDAPPAHEAWRASLGAA